MTWWLGYTYYYLWTRPVPQPAYPRGVPTLFLYGAKKRTMFHSNAFVERLRHSPGCGVLEYMHAGHWLMHTNQTRFNDDVRHFLGL